MKPLRRIAAVLYILSFVGVGFYILPHEAQVTIFVIVAACALVWILKCSVIEVLAGVEDVKKEEQKRMDQQRINNIRYGLDKPITPEYIIILNHAFRKDPNTGEWVLEKHYQG